MDQKYTITNTILNQTFRFSRLYGIMAAQDMNSRWMKKLREAAIQQGGVAAVSIDQSKPITIRYSGHLTDIANVLDRDEMYEYEHYVKALLELKGYGLGQNDLTVGLINRLHEEILGLEHTSKSHFRQSTRILPKIIKENEVYKTAKLEVKTKPKEIQSKLEDFLGWLRSNMNHINVLLLAGICHYKIAEIHPFADGNGRLSRVFENGVLHQKGIEYYEFLPTEDFYLRNRERYYDLIERSINTQDLTEWLEFYTEGLLDSVLAAVDLLYKISGGTIDINNNKYVMLSEREEEMIEIIGGLGQASGAEIAKQLGVSRQNINIILKKLFDKNILVRIGENTSSRYKLAIN